MRRRVRAAVTVVIVVVGVMAVLWALQRQLIYFPDRGPVPAAATVRRDARDVELRTDDGLRLAAWLLPAATRNGAAQDRRIVVLVAPGNAGHRGGRLALADGLTARGLTVLLLDYRGYGGNPGSPSEDGLARDARAAWAYLTGPGGFPPERVVLFGESLGAAVVTRLAADLCAAGSPPGGLVLRSPFRSLAAVGRVHYPMLPVGLLLRDRFEVAARLDRVTVPTSVVYGSEDSIVPPAQSRDVASSAARPAGTVVVPGADHNDPALVAGPLVLDAVTAVADRLR